MDRKLQVALIRGPIVMGAGSVNNEATPAIGFAYIMGYLKHHGYQPVMIDAIGEGLNRFWSLDERPGYQCQGLKFEEIIQRIPKNSDVIGFSGMFSGEWPVLRRLINEVRKQFPKALFVAGGEHVTALTAYILKDCRALDICIRGEGEHTFYTLLELFSKSEDYLNVAGTAYLDSSSVYRQIDSEFSNNKLPRLLKDNAIPWPYWPEGYLEKFWSKGKSYGIATGRDMPFMLSRGCPFQCTFCSNQRMWGNRYVLRNIDDVIEEIKFYIIKYRITGIQLYDLTAITKKKWTLAFFNRLLAEKIDLKWSFPSGTRSEVLDEEILLLLSKVGCKYLVYAPESGSHKTLKEIKKRVDLEKLTRSALIAKKLGMNTRINLIIGFPHETWNEIFETIWYGLKMSFKGIDDVPLFIFSPYPGTQIFNDLYNSNQLKLNDDYFFSLTSLNGSYTNSSKIISTTPNLNSKLLGIVRTCFIFLNYGIGYLFFPSRIFKTLSLLILKQK